MAHAKLLFLDIETLPNLGFCWGKYEQNIIEFTQERCLATVAYKWEGQPVRCLSLPDYKGYHAGSYDDAALARDVWKLLDAADIVVAHNGDQFDVRVLNARFIVNNLAPPSPYKTVDTKKAAKRVGMFNSNKLDDLGRILVNDKKIKTDFSLWLGCINGDKKSWHQMVTYNKKDVLLLEKVYRRIRGWIPNHPPVRGDVDSCPRCGGDVIFKGYTCSSTRRYQRFKCNACGGWGRVTIGSERISNLVV
jgi:hypothetical protein